MQYSTQKLVLLFQVLHPLSDPRLPSQLQVVTAHLPVLNYTFRRRYRERANEMNNFISFPLARPPSSSFLKITDRFISYASPCLWNQLPLSLRKPHSGTSSSTSCSPIPLPITSSSSDSPLCTSITPSLFHSRLKTYIFHKDYPP